MDLAALLQRAPARPFAPGEGVPWNDPAFSERMLREHLSQDHDRASRRSAVIDRQVAWLHGAVLGGRAARVLDLGCGPGLYTSRLAALGHTCTGIDFSPASIAYAEAEAKEHGLACTYTCEDLREAPLGEGFDLVMMLFGELCTLAPADAEALLARMRAALTPEGRVVLEPLGADYVRALGEAGPHWSTARGGLFGDDAHLVLRESAWHAEARATTERYFVFHEDGRQECFVVSTHAWEDDALEAAAERAGFAIAGRYESLTGEEEPDAELYGLVLEPA